MTISRSNLLLAAGATAAVLVGVAGSADAQQGASAGTKGDPVASAESAAPPSIARNATIVTMNADGKMNMVRQGKNGWTCIPDSPATPGPDPMCMDKNAAAWATAWMGKKPPTDGVPGVMYMLAGGTDASNTDPYAKAPTQGGDWIKTGPHIMVVASKAVLAGYPSGPGPDTKAPYVMWAGTPYAQLMIPVER